MKSHRTLGLVVGWGVVAVSWAGGCYSWDVVPLGGGESDDETEPAVAGTGGAGEQNPALATVGSGAAPGAGGTGSTTTTVGQGPSVTSVTTGGGDPMCGGEGCEACVYCAIEYECQVEASACGADPGCQALADCALGCVTDGCLSTCIGAFPGALDLFVEAASCVVCGSCPDECPGLADFVGCSQ